MGVIALAAVLASACSQPPRPASDPPAAVPDSIRLRPLVRKAVEGRVSASRSWRKSRRQVDEHLWMHIIPSDVVPGLAYAWGFFVPPTPADVGPFAGVVGVLDGRTRILQDEEDWARLVGPAAWSPRGPADAIAACVEVTGFVHYWPGPERLYSDTASELFASTYPHQVEVMKARLTNPSTGRTAGEGWEVGYWMVRPGRSVRYRCLLHPGQPAATAVRILPLDTADVGTILVM